MALSNWATAPRTWRTRVAVGVSSTTEPGLSEGNCVEGYLAWMPEEISILNQIENAVEKETDCSTHDRDHEPPEVGKPAACDRSDARTNENAE